MNRYLLPSFFLLLAACSCGRRANETPRPAASQTFIDLSEVASAVEDRPVQAEPADIAELSADTAFIAIPPDTAAAEISLSDGYGVPEAADTLSARSFIFDYVAAHGEDSLYVFSADHAVRIAGEAVPCILSALSVRGGLWLAYSPSGDEALMKKVSLDGDDAGALVMDVARCLHEETVRDALTDY